MTKPKHPSQLKGKTSKLSREDVERIRHMAREGLQSPREMAQFYRVGAETIRRILRGETWNDLTDRAPISAAELEAEATASLQRMQAMIAQEKTRRDAGEAVLKEMVDAPVTADNPYPWIKR